MSNQCYCTCTKTNTTPKSLFGCEKCTKQVVRRNGLQDDICWSYYGPLPDCCCQTCRRQMELLMRRRKCINFRDMYAPFPKHLQSSATSYPFAMPCNICQQRPESDFPPCPVCCPACMPCNFPQAEFYSDIHKSENEVVTESKSVGDLSSTIDSTTVSTSSDDLHIRGEGETGTEDTPLEDKLEDFPRDSINADADKRNKSDKQEVHFVACSNLEEGDVSACLCKSKDESNDQRSRRRFSKPAIILSPVELQFCCCKDPQVPETQEKLVDQVDVKQNREDSQSKRNSEFNGKEENNPQESKSRQMDVNEVDFCNCSSENEEDPVPKLNNLKKKRQPSYRTERNSKYYRNSKDYQTDMEFYSDDEYEDKEDNLSYSKQYTNKYRKSQSLPKTENPYEDDVPYCYRKRKLDEETETKSKKDRSKVSKKKTKRKFSKLPSDSDNFCKCDKENTPLEYPSVRCCSLVLSCESSRHLVNDQEEMYAGNGSLY